MSISAKRSIASLWTSATHEAQHKNDEQHRIKPYIWPMKGAGDAAARGRGFNSKDGKRRERLRQGA